MEKYPCTSSCNCVDKTTSTIMSKFSVLLNHQKRLLITFSGMIFSHEYRVINCLHSNRKCAKWMEVCGYKMDWTCSVGQVALWSTSKKTHALVSDWRLARFSKSIVTFSEKAIFEKFSSDISTFWVFFNLMYHAVYMHAMNWLKNRLKKDFSRQNAFLHFFFFSPKTTN